MTKGPEKTVSSAAARDLYIICEKLRLAPNRILSDLGIEPSLFNDPQARIPESALIQFWQLLEQNSAKPDIGLLIGQTINPESKGLLASWISQASTLREALNIFFKNIVLMNPSESWQASQQGTLLALTLEISSQETYPVCAIERSMSALVAWARALSAHPLEINSTTFTFTPPCYVDSFRKIFGEEVYFEAKTNSLTFEASQLDRPIVSSNQLLKNLIEEKAMTALNQISNELSVSAKVKQLIDNAMSHGQTLSIEQACELLATSRQTLYRQLQQESTDFKTIYDELRKQRAIDLLNEQTNNIGVISLQLGFKDSSSFYKAFRRWTGTSPKDYLENQRKR